MGCLLNFVRFVKHARLLEMVLDEGLILSEDELLGLRAPCGRHSLTLNSTLASGR